MKNKWHGHNVAIVCVALGGFESKFVILNTCVADRYVHALDHAWIGILAAEVQR